MNAATLLASAVVVFGAPPPSALPPVVPVAGDARVALRSTPAAPSDTTVLAHTLRRLAEDEAALRVARPATPFWVHVFDVPDGSIVYGGGDDGRLLVRFPVRGDWRTGAVWSDPALADVLSGVALERDLSRRRDQVAELLADRVGPVVHNPTRGDFLRPARTYGSFLDEWAAIYERFGVPADVGLAQAAIESGFSGTIRSSANALGLCQWLKRNWERLDRLTPDPIEIQNQTTQAAFCAAYLQVLATRYGSFIPALSEHHAGPGNVGKVLINGERLGAEGVRDRYFTGSGFARELRAISTREFRDVVGSYGPRSFLYSEMVFGNVRMIRSMRETIPQEDVYAVRASRALGLEEIVRATGLSEREVRRYNPALVRRVPKGANLYLPVAHPGFGPDVSFWRRPAPAAFSEVLLDFVRMDATVEDWQDPAFEARLDDFRRRFRSTGSEEGVIMDAVLGYEIQNLRTSRRVLADYRTDPRVREAFDRGILQRRIEREQR